MLPPPVDSLGSGCGPLGTGRALEFARDRSKSRSQKGVSWASRSAPRARGVYADTREDARSRIAITGESLQQLLNRGCHAQGVTSPTAWPPQRMVARRMLRGAVDEAIVKIHSSINLGCVRNPPSREQDSKHRGTACARPLGLVARLLPSWWPAGALCRYIHASVPARARGRLEVQTEALGCVIRDRSTAENSFCRCTACQLAKGPRASVPCPALALVCGLDGLTAVPRVWLTDA